VLLPCRYVIHTLLKETLKHLLGIQLLSGPLKISYPPHQQLFLFKKLPHHVLLGLADHELGCLLSLSPLDLLIFDLDQALHSLIIDLPEQLVLKLLVVLLLPVHQLLPE
jgi:hypothetical protein